MKTAIISFRTSLIFILFIIFAFSTSCNLQDQKSTIKTPDANLEDLPGDFIEFYELFHSDSAYQLKHIAFPLEGFFRDNEKENDIIYSIIWTEENWVLHRRFDPSDTAFTQEFKVLGNSAVTETISALDGLFKIERRFARLSDGWNLIYYYQQ